MKFHIISLFPQLFDGVFSTSMAYKAQQKGLIEISYSNLRDFGVGTRKQVDDTPYGGGNGMLLMAEPLYLAVEYAKKLLPDALVVLMTPRGEKLSQKIFKNFAKDNKNLIIICARYEGYDERVTKVVDRQISLGDFVLSGGEIPAMALVDGIFRLIPGALGGQKSAELESFENGKLEFPQYTRPENFRGQKVPAVLLSGDHNKIAQWRQEKQKDI